MFSSRTSFRASCLSLAILFCAGAAFAAPNAEQKKELKDIGNDIKEASSLTSKKKFDEAHTMFKDIESRLEKLTKDGLNENDPALKPIRGQYEKAFSLWGKQSGRGTVSFAADVAPLLVDKCGSCHGDEVRAGLKMDTFASMKKGGASGALLIAGNPNNSLIIKRITAPNPMQRMPKNAESLSPKQINIIGTWIAEGAKFDGADENTELKSLSKKPAAGPAPKVEISKPTGNEKVSFIKDVAPTFVTTCGMCHNDNRKAGGLSVTTFEKLMQGGDSGRVIVAGSLEGSRLWRLVNADEAPVMPAGQARISREWHAALKTWIEEGAKFDGPDAKRPLRQLVPTDEEIKAAALAKLTPEEHIKRRVDDAKSKWKKTYPNAEANHVESAQFYVLGDVPEARLKEVDAWATEQAKTLKQAFSAKDEQLWRGKLAIFVFKDRFGYQEFNTSVQGREVDREIFGHSEVTALMEDAFVAVQDVGDAATESSPGTQISVMEHVTSAFLKRGGGSLPEWVTRGAGLALAGQKSPGNPYLSGMPSQAGQILRDSRIEKPEDVFKNGTFSPGEVGPIGYSLVDFMLKRGSPAKFGQFVARLQAGDGPEAAIKTVYGTDAKSLATQYASALPAGGPKKGKK